MNNVADGHSRTHITHVSEDGLRLDNRVRTWTMPWTEIDDVAAARLPNGDKITTVLAFGHGGAVLLVAETDPIWQELVQKLPHGLNGVPPFEEWDRALPPLPVPDPTILFSRDG